MKTRIPLIALASMALVTTQTLAVDSFTLTDGDVSLTLNGLEGNRLTVSGGIGSLITEVSTNPIDHLHQNWFWVRTEDDAREYALSNQAGVSTASANRARLVYVEPANDGGIANALMVELEYTLSDLSGPRGPRAMLTIGFKMRNLTNQSMSVQLFNYCDLDLGLGVSDDVAAVSGTDDHVQLIDDPTGTEPPAQAVYIASATNHLAYEIAPFSSIRDDLVDGGIDSLSNASANLGPGNVTGANHWGALLAAAGSVQDTLVGSVTIEVTSYGACPADIVPTGDVNIDDLFNLIGAWGQCP